MIKVEGAYGTLGYAQFAQAVAEIWRRAARCRRRIIRQATLGPNVRPAPLSIKGRTLTILSYEDAF